MAKVRRRIPAEELPGETMTRDHVAGYSDPRDAMSKDYRVKIRDMLEEYHQANNDLSKLEFGSVARLFGGGKGDGKTSVGVHRLMQHYAAGGYVFSIHGVGFGQQITIVEMLKFAEICPPQSRILLEEGHLLVSTYGASALRNELLNNSMTMSSTPATTSTLPVLPRTRSTGAFEPRSGPRCTRAIRTGHDPGQYHFPPDAYKWPWLIGDYPWGDRSPRLEDIYVPFKKRVSPVIAQPMASPVPPQELYWAWSLMDSWSEPSVSEGATMGADKINKILEASTDDEGRERLAQLESPDNFYASLLWIWESGNYDLGDRPIPWRDIDDAAREGGFESEDEYAGLHILQQTLGRHMTTQNKVRPDVLREFLVKLAVESPVEM